MQLLISDDRGNPAPNIISSVVCLIFITPWLLIGRRGFQLCIYVVTCLDSGFFKTPVQSKTPPVMRALQAEVLLVELAEDVLLGRDTDQEATIEEMK